MKNKKKILFALVLTVISLSTVYAGSYIYSASTYLENIINGNNVVNYPLSTTKDMGRYFNTHIKDIKSVIDINGGSNASGGIRVFTTVKRKNNILWTFNEERKDGIYSTTTGSLEQFWNVGQAGTKATTVEWQNRTGNTRVTATFNIEQL